MRANKKQLIAYLEDDNQKETWNKLEKKQQTKYEHKKTPPFWINPKRVV